MRGSERSSDPRWAWSEQLAASGRQLLGIPHDVRRSLAATAAPAASQAVSPAATPATSLQADVDSRPCKEIQDTAATGSPLNFTSVEAFCLNQVRPCAA